MSEPAKLQVSVVEKPPQTETEGWVPKVDMIFESEDKAYWFYCNYAKEMGFGVRKHHVKRRANGSVSGRVFSCYKEGFGRNIKPKSKPRTDVRTGCGAHLTIRAIEKGQFCVTEFDPIHNHDLLAKSAEQNTGSANNLAISKTKKPKKTVLIKKYVPRASTSTAGSAGPVVTVSPSTSGTPSSAGPGTSSATLIRGVATRMPNPGPAVVTTGARISISVPNSLVPKMGMEFDDDEEAYRYYVTYADSIGFSVRKHQVKRRASGLVYSRTFVCHKEGFRKKTDAEKEREPKPYDRTGCQASITVRIMKNGRFQVIAFEPKHNHPLVIPSKAHLVKWRWRRRYPSLMPTAEEEEEETLGSSEQEEDEIGESCIGVTKDCKNYIPRKKKATARSGELGMAMQYFQKKQTADPSFYYGLQLDLVDRVTNIFWTDSKSKFDFEFFGDVVCFDTTYKYSDSVRPLALFLGINHHRQIIIFGSAFLYDESKESLKWLFETFKSAMGGKQPKVVLTDRHLAIGDWLSTVWPSTVHRFCVWQVYNEGLSFLNPVFLGSNSFGKEFSRCIFHFDEAKEFEVEWGKMLESYELKSNVWLAEVYEERERWAPPYGHEIFCGDIKSSLRKENISDIIKKHSDHDFDFMEFVRNFERTVEETRQNELQADTKIEQYLVLFPFTRMLKQAMDSYTTTVFKIFQTEFEFSLDFMVHALSTTGAVFEYKVTNGDEPKEFLVRFDSSEVSIECSCKKFEHTGLPCRHIIKTLDIVNVKELPDRYLLKRWTKQAKQVVYTREDDVNVFDGDSDRSDVARRYSALCSILSKLAVRASESEETFSLIKSLSGRGLSGVHQSLVNRMHGEATGS
ncbi:FAR1-related sequence 7 [Rhynchospora pubera]|uniref:Protein FAR1-RELATED SEQUENCE n=1 Tax=Rhynchospora pubera TaxID=906938 RepID=A0AAV8FBC0_9POAL|nr:FAR1-related sequence 7 [Rhynchospora pubera]